MSRYIDDPQRRGDIAVPPGMPSPRPGTVRRRGPLGWWLDLTAPSPPANRAALSAVESERLRKAELTSYSILAVAFFLGMLFSNSIADSGTASAVVLMAFFLLVTALLNRFGATRVAAYIIPSALTLLTMLAVVSAPGGLRLIVLPAYDLFVIPIFIAALTADWRAPWFFVAIASAFIVGDWLIQPHALVTATGVDLTGTQGFNELAREAQIFTAWGMINRHLALAMFAGLFSSLGAFSVERAILRADQAEHVAALEHAQAEQRKTLEEGVQAILQTHIRLANGDFSARTPPVRDPLLWQVGQSLNNLASRVQNTGRAEFQLRRVEDELQRLASALDDARMGRPPIWPAPAGTPVDPIVDRLSGRRPAGSPPSVAPPAAPQRAQWSDQLPPHGGYDGYGDNQPSRQAAPRPAGPPYENPWGQR